MNTMANTLFLIIAFAVGAIAGYIISYYQNRKCVICGEGKETHAERELRILQEKQRKADLEQLIKEASTLQKGY